MKTMNRMSGQIEGWREAEDYWQRRLCILENMMVQVMALVAIGLPPEGQGLMGDFVDEWGEAVRELEDA